MTHILDKLYETLQSRKSASGDKSYVASLYEKGTPKIAEKILEEAREFIDEALLLDQDPTDRQTQKNIRAEAADLLIHTLVMLSHHNIPPEEIFAILQQRFGMSGHAEKAARK